MSRLIGLTDGEEINTHLTDPLAEDTDGDGISDGDEVAQGSNPLDPTSTRADSVQIPFVPSLGLLIFGILILAAGIRIQRENKQG